MFKVILTNGTELTIRGASGNEVMNIVIKEYRYTYDDIEKVVPIK